MSSSDDLYPLCHLLPKKDTQVTDFLAKHPTWDGRGITVGVLDTGVDPASPGLQLTSDGKAKIIDISDCSGAGDVDTSVVRTAENGVLMGLSGRKLTIPDSWHNPTGKYHLGLKPVFELYGKQLLDRRKKERMERAWSPAHRLSTADAHRQLEMHEREHASLDTLELKWERDNLQAQVEVLKNLDKNMDDTGPVADCIVFNDGQKWRACLDTSFAGRLESARLLGCFRDTGDYAKMTDDDMLTYSFNVHRNGNLLEIAATSNCHGTHVAAIVSAHVPNTPDLNGCAPGAQIVSLGVNDGRLGSMETGTSLTRALNRCIELGVQIINYSFGEASHWQNEGYISAHGTHVAAITGANFPEDPDVNGAAPGAQLLCLTISDARLGARSGMETGAALTRALNSCIEMGVQLINLSFGEAAHWQNKGRIIKAIEEAVWKHNIIFVSSAGNNGPALSTNGCPGSTNDCSLGVSAYLSPQMMTALYSVREKMPGILFPWSARGPAPDGSLGICVSAPGGAITSMPKWTLKGTQLLNGTSMSSPNAAGTIACLLSALRSVQLTATPFNVRLALENTAKSLPDTDQFSMGRGLLQLDSAFEYFSAHHEKLETSLVRYNVSIGDTMRGIYLRELHQQRRPREFAVHVEPIFHENADNEERVAFSKHLVLCCDANWVQHPSHLELGNMDRQFNVRIDPTGLAVGAVHYTELKALDSSCLDLGPLWRVPITVIVPEQVSDRVHFCFKRQQISCKPAQSHRFFIHVPEGAQYAVLKLESHDSEKFCRFVLHAIQLLPHQSYRANESFKMANLSENGDTTQSFSVVGGRTLEFCLTKWWSNLGESSVSFELSFHGLTVLESRISMLSCETVKKVEVINNLANEDLNPSINLRSLCQPLKPSDAKLKALGPRDLFQDGRQIYELVLSYNLSLSKSAECTCELPGLSEYLYESELDCQLWMVFNTNKEYIFAGEAFPTRYSTKLEKGDYVIRVQLRHENDNFLDRFRDLCLVVQHKLSSPISLDCYSSYPAAVNLGGKKLSSTTLASGSRMPLYITPPGEEKGVKSVSPGWYYSGVMSLPKDDLGRKCSQVPFVYFLTDVPKKPRPASVPVNYAAKKQIEKTKQQEMNESVRDLKIGWIPKLGFVPARTLYQELLTESPNHLPLHQAYLKRLTDVDPSKHRQDILKTVQLIQNLIDADELLKFFGTKLNVASDENSASKSEMDNRKQLLIEVLVTKGSVLADQFLSDAPDSVPQGFRRGAPVKLRSPAKRKTRLQAPTPTDLTPKSSASDLQTFDVEKSPGETTEARVDTPVMIEADGTEIEQKVALGDIDAVWVELMKWTDDNDSKVLLFSAKHAVAHKHYGRSLKLLNKAVEEQPSKDLELLCAEIYDQLGWVHAAQNVRDTILVKYPPSYRPF